MNEKADHKFHSVNWLGPLLALDAESGEEAADVPGEDGRIAGGPAVRLDRLRFADPLVEYCVAASEAVYVHELTSLNCDDISVTGASDLEGIEQLTALRSLSIGPGCVTDLGPLAGLTRLKFLMIGRNRVASLAPLAGLRNLTSLSIYGNPVAGLAPLAGLRGLVGLGLFSCGVGDLGPLSGLGNLWTLNVPGNALAGDGLAPLSGLRKLRYLDFSANQDVADLRPLAGLTHLRYLDGSMNSIRDLTPLSRLSALKVVNLSWNPIVTGAGKLTALKAPERIQLGGYPTLPHAELQALHDAFGGAVHPHPAQPGVNCRP